MSKLFPSPITKADFTAHANCANSPLDVRPAANMVLHALARTIRQTSPSKPIVIILGEHHNKPIDIMVQYFLIQSLHSLAQKGLFDLAVGFEQPYDFLATLQCRYKQRKVLAKPMSHQKMHQTNLLTFLTSAHPFSAKTAYLSLATYCFEKRIPTTFNDLPRYDDGKHTYLSDHKNGTKSADERLRLDSLEAIKKRNNYIAKSCIRPPKSGRRQVYVQIVGQDHLYGIPGVNDSATTGLHAILEDLSAAPISLFIEHSIQPAHTMPTSMRKLGGEKILITGLDDTSHGILTNARDQRTYIDQVLAANDGKIDYIAPHTRKQKMHKCLWRNLKL